MHHYKQRIPPVNSSYTYSQTKANRARIKLTSPDGARWVMARGGYAYLWQGGRFADDQSFWADRLTRRDDITTIDDNGSLKFLLESTEDFAAFRHAIDELAEVAWTDQNQSPEDA